jgi:hypothetical protein
MVELCLGLFPQHHLMTCLMKEHQNNFKTSSSSMSIIIWLIKHVQNARYWLLFLDLKLQFEGFYWLECDEGRQLDLSQMTSITIYPSNLVLLLPLISFRDG